MRSGLLRLHWLDVQRHIYAHAAHGFAMSLPGGWDAFLWQHFNRKGALLCARRFARLEPVLRFLEEHPHALVETDVYDATSDINLALLDAGFHTEYMLPGHFIPATNAFISRLALTMPLDRLDIRLVEDRRTLADFAYVQDQAYRASYDWPKGCALQFYTDPASLIGPDSIGAVLYDDGLPVRTAAIIRKRGIVAGVAGAAHPDIRGQHTGEGLMFLLLNLARHRWGTTEVHHITMPCATPIAKRLGLEQVTEFRRWRRA